MTTQPDDNAAARDEAQAAKFRQYLSDQYADDESPTLVLGPEVEFRDAEQLAAWRREMANIEPLPFDATTTEDE